MKKTSVKASNVNGLRKFVREDKGFTIMEVIIVIAIIMVLTAILVPSYLGFVESAREANVKVSAQNVYSAVQIANINIGNVETSAELLEEMNKLIPGIAGIGAVVTTSSNGEHSATVFTEGNSSFGLPSTADVTLAENVFFISEITVDNGFSFTFYKYLNGNLYEVEYVSGVPGDVAVVESGTQSGS